MGYRIAKEGTARVALDALEHGVIRRFGGLEPRTIDGIELKVDYGSQNTVELFRKETQCFGFELAYSFVGNPTGNAIVERINRLF